MAVPSSWTSVVQTLEQFVCFFFFCSFIFIGSPVSLSVLYMLTTPTFLLACRFALDLRCLMPACTPSTSSLPIRVCLLTTCYLLEKMTEPMQVSSAYTTCKAFHLVF